MKNRGFSLLETLIAMMILSSAIILLASSWSGSYARLRKTQLKTEVVALLQRKMVEVDMQYKGKPLETIPEEPIEGDFGSEYPQYTWTVESKEFTFPDVTPMLTARDGGANEILLMIMRTLREHLNKTVREVKVTVWYTPASTGDPIPYSIVTYYVDYNKQIPVPGLPGGGG